MIELRDYQHEGIAGVRQKLREGHRSVLLVMATGGGKTVVATSIIRAAEEKGSRCVFLAHRRELIDQTAAKLVEFGVRPGVILAGRPKALQRPVQVASVQSLARVAGELGQVDLVFVDEAHHLKKGNTYDQLLRQWPRAKVVGLTATPWRLDGAGLADVFESHVIVRTPRQLRDEGHLVGVTGWEYAPIDTRGVKLTGGDYNAGALEQRAMSAKLFGEIISEWKAHAASARTVLFAITIAHSAAMAKAFREAGVPAEHLDGATPNDERAAILHRIRTGATRVLCNVNVCTEGWDLPDLECVVLARPTLSLSLYLQQVGRALRPSPGKTVARIHDHARCLATHGHPYAARDFSPEKSCKGDRKSAENNVRRDARCPNCKAVIHTYPCEGCGHMPAPQQVEVDRNAQRRAIVDGPGWDAVRARINKQAVVAAEFRGKTQEEKREQYLKLVERHGSRKALGVYHWMSGGTEWPPHEWRLESAVVRPGSASP